jgi:hypothetical protein
MVSGGTNPQPPKRDQRLLFMASTNVTVESTKQRPQKREARRVRGASKDRSFIPTALYWARPTPALQALGAPSFRKTRRTLVEFAGVHSLTSLGSQRSTKH